jgi:hypothetical protein
MSRIIVVHVAVVVDFTATNENASLSSCFQYSTTVDFDLTECYRRIDSGNIGPEIERRSIVMVN